MLSLNDRCDIGFRAASVPERLAAAAVRGAHTGHAAPPPPGSAAVLHAWQQAFSPNDPHAFARRLAWDGLDAAAVAKGIDASSSLQIAPPAWTVWLTQFCHQAAELAHELFFEKSLPEIAWLRESEEPPFLEVWLALVRAGRKELRLRDPQRIVHLPTSVRHAFERQWFREVSLAGELAVFEHYRAFVAATDASQQDRYAAFIAYMLRGGLADLFKTYPVLARQLAIIMDGAVSAADEFLIRVDNDRAAIAKTFFVGTDPGIVTTVELGLSDPHHGRRRVIVLRFESGDSLVYKPRDVGLERAYNEFLGWLASQGLDPAPPALTLLERDGYGWVEYVPPAPCASEADVHASYFGAGALLCVTWLLGGRDLHKENVIAGAKGPVLIDVEMLLQPSGSSLVEQIADTNVQESSESVPRSTCLETGLLSMVQSTPDGTLIDIGGLRGQATAAGVKRRVWKSLRTDAVHFVEEPIAEVDAANLVRLGDQVQRADAFADDVTRGFERTYRLLLSHRDQLLAPNGPLSLFLGRTARVMFRPSGSYAAAHQTLASPPFQRSGLLRSVALDSLNRVFNTAPNRPSAWPLVDVERLALEALDVPRFTVAIDDTVVDQGRRAGRVFEQSGIAAVRSRLATLSESDLDAHLALLRDTLSESMATRYQQPLPQPDPGRPSVLGSPARRTTSTAGYAEGPEASTYPDPVVPATSPALPHGRAQGSAAGESHANSKLLLPRDGAEGRGEGELFVDHALWLGEELLARGIRDGDRLTWDTKHFRCPDAVDLYGGAAGPALFFAALHRVTGDATWADAARATAETILGETVEVDGIGICRGAGAMIYSLAWLGRLLDAQEYIDAAAHAAGFVTVETVQADRALDVVGGTAGALLALLTLHQDTHDEELIETALACGDHLLGMQIERAEGIGWLARDGFVHAGFAHGAAGIAFALMRLAEATGRDEYRDTAVRAYEFERHLFSAPRGNWPVMESADPSTPHVPTWMTSWCHGAPGIALARTLALHIKTDPDNDAATRNEIRVAVNTTVARRPTPSEHLCCGNLGRAEVLLTLGQRLGEASLVEAARTITRAALIRARAKGHFTLSATGFAYRVFDPGFFQGMSGIGYHLLRLAAPGQLPAILGFETHLAEPSGQASKEARYEHA